MNRKGSALLFTLGVVVVLTVLGLGYGSHIINENAVARRNLASTQAFWITEAGIQKAAWDYDHNQCHGMRNAGTGTACTSCESCGIGLTLYTGTLGNGDFSVTFDRDTKTLISTGSVWQGGVGNILLARRKIKVFFGRDYIFGYAAFSQGTMVISNNSHIDSYNSANGPYNPATAGSRGNMGTNGSAVNVIDIGNNAIIHGSVSTGPGGTVDYQPSKVTITGGITHTNDVYIEPVSVPAALQTTTFSGILNVTATTDLAAGSYRFDKITIGNNGTLNINGPVEIYLTNATTGLTTGNNTVAINVAPGASVVIYTEGKVDLGNKVMINNTNANPKPADFQIYSLFSGSDGVVIDNNNVFYGTVYAPLTDVEVSNNGQFFGSIVGDEVEVSNNGIMHYDEALGEMQAPWQPAEPRDWQEQFD
jgi:hypothetical protein